MTDFQEDDYYVQRSAKMLQKLNNNETVYPHKYYVKDTVKNIIKKYENIASGEKSDDIVQSAGRIMAQRNLGKLNFWKLMDDSQNIQLVLSLNASKSTPEQFENFKGITFYPETFAEALETLKRGDVVGFTGHPGRTKTGELSIFITSISLLTPCLRTLPVEHFGVKDSELIYRRRYLDLLLNQESKNRFIIRSNAIKYIRRFLDERDFVEVETPMMNLIPGGAAAKPFITHHNELKLDLYMRISPELYLKQLVVGGMNRVYELGKDYRNEGIDLTHNPEFTTCEFYMAYGDYNDLMTMTEDMLHGMVKEICNTEVIEYWPMKREERPEKVNINFQKPFRRIDIAKELNYQMNLRIAKWSDDVNKKLAALNINSSKFELRGDNLEELYDFLVLYLENENIKLSNPITLPRILDKLIGEYIEPQCINPTFLIHHPVEMSPLAKKSRVDPSVTERFELFINGKEICNAYTELNDPFDQRARFEEQVKQSQQGDDEAMKMDMGFVMALEYGLPPTAGWGIGIDRFVMILTNAANIRDVILFPAMKPEEKNKPDIKN